MKPIATNALTRSGLKLTQLGFGTASIGGLYRAVEEATAAEVLEAAYAAGIRYYDTAPYYGSGLAEQRLGQFLARHGKGGIVVSSKVGRVLDPAEASELTPTGYVGGLPNRVSFDYSYDGIMRSFEASRARLGREPDILYVHDIGARRHREANAAHYAALMDGGMRALDELRRGTGVRAFGLGVNETAIGLDVLRDGDIDIILLANRYTLLDHDGAAELMRACAARQVDVVAGGVFNSGILAAADPATGRFDYKQADASIIARVEALRDLSARHNVGLIDAALAFPLRNSVVRSVLIGTASVAELNDCVARSRSAIPAAFWSELQTIAAPELDHRISR